MNLPKNSIKAKQTVKTFIENFLYDYEKQMIKYIFSKKNLFK
jgi:hypothetical protein